MIKTMTNPETPIKATLMNHRPTTSRLGVCFRTLFCWVRIDGICMMSLMAIFNLAHPHASRSLGELRAVCQQIDSGYPR